VLRKLLKEEVAILFECQRELGSSFCSEDFCDNYTEIAFYQRPLQSSAKLVGKCTFEKDEPRAPKYSYTTERFLALQKINNLKMVDKSGETLLASNDQIQATIDKVFNSAKVTYAQLRKVLNLPDNYQFNLLTPKKDESVEEAEKKTTFFEAKGYNAFRKLLEKKQPTLWSRLSQDGEMLDAICWPITVEQDDEKIEAALVELGFSQEEAEQLSALSSFSGHVSLSIKAMRQLIPHMEQGMRYDEARKAVGYADDPFRQSQGLSLLPALTEETRTRNPVVDRAISQSRKVINAIIRRYGMPDRIHIELARELGKTWKDRADITKQQREFADRKNAMVTHFCEIFRREPRRDELLRFRLWKEQKEWCPYSMKAIPTDLVIDAALEVDHIIPFSRCFDDSLANKVLVYASENQRKGNKTPYEAFGHESNRWDAFEVFVQNYPIAKRRRLLRKELSEKDANEWKSRHLNDTRYLSRYIYNYLRSNLAIGEADKNSIATRSGQITSFLRANWGLLKNREENDLHHAQDALVVALATTSMEQQIIKASQAREVFRDKEAQRIPFPWPSFRVDVERALSQVFISRRPQRSGKGAAHQDTVRSLRVAQTEKGEEKVVLQRVALEALSENDLNNLYDKERNFKLVAALRERLAAHGGKADKAFKEAFYMPTSIPGKVGPRVRAVTVDVTKRSGVAGVVLSAQTSSKQGGSKKSGLASNDKIVRVDVFSKGKGFYCVPVYVSDLCKAVLPNRAVVAMKDEAAWIQVDDSFCFEFSLFPNDYLKLTKPDGTDCEGYYRRFDRATAQVGISSHLGGDAEDKRIGSKTLKRFEKYAVNIFGELTKVSKEKRLDVANRSHRQRGKSKKKE
jgi:CRISPR-associated endonuclease Csn1